ncbi:MAG TPA: hypothetical protein VGI75_10850, partial [Pirellulales bacterium]
MAREGRKTGSKNVGYFYRAGRGWYTKKQGQFFALTDDRGEKLRDPKATARVIKNAYHNWLKTNPFKNADADTSDITVIEVCNAYLAEVEANGAEQTFSRRADTLFDFCFGLPARFREKHDKATKSNKIHEGFGSMKVSELKPIHVDRWTQAHPSWNGGKRTKIQALKRALNYAA